MGINFLLLPGRFQGLNSGHQVCLSRLTGPLTDSCFLTSLYLTSSMASSDFLFCSASFSFAEGLTHMVVRRRTHLLALWATWPTFGSQISVFSYDK